MLCPSCGDEMKLSARECGCGARMVGEPTGEPVAKIQRFGPAMLALSLFICTALAAAVWTKWAATAGVLVIVLSRRAIILALRDRESYGGLGIAIAVLAIASVSGASLAGYAIGRIPLTLDKRRLAQTAATGATIYELANALEDYKSKNGAYPQSDQVLRKFLGRSLPKDYWDQTISYESYTEAIAEANLGRRPSQVGPVAGTQFNHNFVLRSAGPDGAMGSGDDIVMKDGVFYASADLIRKPLVR